jgi:DnaK suppressor protein
MPVGSPKVRERTRIPVAENDDRDPPGRAASGVPGAAAIPLLVVAAKSEPTARHRARLLALRAEILSQGDIALEPGRADPVAVGGDEDEQALSEMHQVIASRRNRVRTGDLGRIQAALKRLDEDPESFGLCSECGEPIGKRLELMPFVELCVECQQAKDGNPRGPGRRHLRDFR